MELLGADSFGAATWLAPWAWAILLLMVGFGLAVMEVFIPSGGILGFLAICSLIAAIAVGFMDGRTWVGFGILTAAGARNVVARTDRRYPEIRVEDLVRSGPRVVLLPDDPYPFTVEEAAAIEAAVPGAAALRIPGEWVAWYGSRMGEAIRGLAARLAPFR